VANINKLCFCVVTLQAIPGAADVIKHLKAAGVPYRFVTNTTTDKRAGTNICLGTSALHLLTFARLQRTSALQLESE
jgi:hypothetical protein